MTSEEYIKQQIAAGYDIHYNDGVWWMKVAPFFYKPVNTLQIIEKGKANPKIHKALFGYIYLVSDSKFANKYWSVLLMKDEQLSNFGMQSLSSSKRAQVRKGLKLTEIRKIDNIEEVIEDIKNICISAAIRTRHGKSPEYYTSNYNEWRNGILKLFKLSGGQWLGSFYNDALIAYYYTVQIGDTVIIEAAKSHTDFLDKCPNDALLFTFIEECKKLTDCKKIIFGDWSNDAPTLNVFKQKYGFERVELPMYVKYNPFVYAAKQINDFMKNRRTDTIYNDLCSSDTSV